MPNEAVSERLGTTDGYSIAFSERVGYAPFRPDSLLVTCGDEIFEPSENNTLKSNKGSTGYFDSSRGTLTIVFANAPPANQSILVTYRYMPKSLGVYQMYQDSQGRITFVPLNG